MISARRKLKSVKPISSQSRLFVEAEKRHIQAHLALTELRLRITRPKSTKTQYNRQASLDILHDYWKEGVFPRNLYKTAKRTPVFIDGTGTHCAVGQLMSRTGHSELAKDIDRNDKFVLVEELHDPRVEAWLREYGLSREEAALIQPGYGGFVIERVGYAVQDKILAGMTLVACLSLIEFVVLALRVLKNYTLAKPQKRNRLAALGTGTALITAGLIFYLPSPSRAVNALTAGATGKETINCDGWGKEWPPLCSEFQQKGGVPGWREVH